MANRRVLVKRRKAIQNIRKITRTMQLIATARFQAAFGRATASKPYVARLTEGLVARRGVHPPGDRRGSRPGSPALPAGADRLLQPRAIRRPPQGSQHQREVVRVARGEAVLRLGQPVAGRLRCRLSRPAGRWRPSGITPVP